MALPPRAPRPRTADAPAAPALEAVLELPLRFTLSGVLCEQLAALEDAARAATPGEARGPLYERAFELLGAVLVELEEQQEALQRRTLALPDASTLRSEVVDGPRRKLEQAVATAEAALQQTVSQWTERGRRQQAQIHRRCLDGARHLQVESSDEGSLALAEQWLADYTRFAQDCVDTWTERVLAGAEQELRQAAGTLARLPEAGGLPITPPPQRPPEPGGVILYDPPTQRVELPSLAQGLGRSLRTNVMAVGIVGSMLAGVVALIGSLAGAEGGASTMAVRGGLIVVLLPLLVVFGVRSVRAEQRQARARAAEAFEQQAQKWLDRSTSQALQAHAGRLDRWRQARAAEWSARIQAWSEQAIAPAVEQLRDEARQRIQEVKLEQAQLTEQLLSLKQSRRRLTEKLGLDLQRAIRDTQRAGGTP